MKKLKGFKNYPLLLAIVLSSLLLSCIGFFGKDTIYLDYSVELLKTPRLAVVFQGIGEGNTPWSLWDKKSQNEEEAVIEEKDPVYVEVASNNVDDINIKGSNEKDGIQVNDGTKEENILGEKDDLKSETSKDSIVKDQSNQDKYNDQDQDNDIYSKSNANDDRTSSKGNDKNTSDRDNSKENSSTTFAFNKVTQDYFDDALFIGDSRTVGLSEYSGWSNPTYYADVGMTIYDIFEKKIAKVGGHKVTVEEALKKNDFKKIYIMLGINELGTGTSKTFTKEYIKVMKRIKQLQPDAIIFIQGIMNVTKEKSDSDPIFNNKNIKDRNEHIAKLADNKTVFYIDVNEAITDESGGIPSKYTFDNIHLKASYYKIWTKFLMKHGVVGKE